MRTTLCIAIVLCGCFTPYAVVAADDLEELIIYGALRPDNWDLYLFKEPGAEPRRLTDDPSLDYNAVFSPDGRYVVFCSERRGNPDLYVLDLKEGGAPRALTRSAALDDAPSVSPDGKKLAFVSTRDGNADIFTMPFDPNGGESAADVVNLTRDTSGDFNPAWSPDGKRIAFSSDRDRYRSGEIYVMDADGSNLRRLTDSAAWDGSPAWSKDGATIYFYSEREKPAAIYAVRADGGNPRKVNAESSAALSPVAMADGRIAFATQRDGSWRIISSAKDGSATRLESDSARDYWAPSFDPDSGRMICHGAGPSDESKLFGSRTPGRFLIDDTTRVALPDREVRISAIRGFFPSLGPGSRRMACSSGFEALLTCRLDGSEAIDVFKPEQGSAWRATWSKDGRFIATGVGPTFGQPGQNVDIWRFGSDGQDPVNLTADSEANNAFPYFSPDGERIVFRSGRDGNHELYLMDSQGGNIRRLTDNPATDTMPAFSPRGDSIAFTSTRDDGDYEIYTLAVDSEGNPGALTRITHSPRRDTHPKFSPDAKWLVFTSERGGINDEEPLIPVFNPQPYGDIHAVRLSDGLVVRLTHNKWEDGTPTWGKSPE